jgi:hypothetical protein
MIILVFQLGKQPTGRRHSDLLKKERLLMASTSLLILLKTRSLAQSPRIKRKRTSAAGEQFI